MSRTKAERQAIDRDGTSCRRCGRSLIDFPASLHHRQPKGAGGGAQDRYDRVENLVLLCGSGSTPHCHLWAHTATERYELGWLVHRWDEPAEIPLVDLAGEILFLTQEGDVISVQTVPLDLRRVRSRSGEGVGRGTPGDAAPHTRGGRR